MARKRAPELSRIAGFYATSNERIEEAQQRFEEARMTLTNAQTFGTEAHGTAAGKAFVDAAENYANALRTHARLVVEYAAERKKTASQLDADIAEVLAKGKP